MGEVVPLFGKKNTAPKTSDARKTELQKGSGDKAMSLLHSHGIPAIDLLKGMLEGVMGDAMKGTAEGNIEKSASQYDDVLAQYSDEQIVGLLADADGFKKTKPAFYKALRDIARRKKLII